MKLDDGISEIVPDNFARRFSLHAGNLMWLLGAGALASVGIPTAYIGISYAVRPSDSDRPRFVTCCSQVFDAEGSGLEFVAYDAHEVEIQRDNPFLSRTEMFRVMTRSMDLYRRRAISPSAPQAIPFGWSTPSSMKSRPSTRNKPSQIFRPWMEC